MTSQLFLTMLSLFLYLFVYISSIYPSIHPSIYPSIYPFIKYNYNYIKLLINNYNFGLGTDSDISNSKCLSPTNVDPMSTTLISGPCEGNGISITGKLQSANILLLLPKYETIMVPSNHSFFQYCFL